MQTPSAVESKRKKWQFAGLYIISLILIIIAFTAFLNPAPTTINRDTNKDRPQTNLLDASIFLQQKWFQLQDLKGYLQTQKAMPDSQVVTIKESLQNNKNDFKKSLDSVEVITSNNASDEKSRELGEVILSYRKALQKNETGGGITDSADNGNLSAATITARGELATKDNRINQLEKELSDLRQSVLSQAQVKDNRIRELQKQLENSKLNTSDKPIVTNDASFKETNFLKLAVRSQVQEIKKLKETNADLQKSNVKLNAQVADLKKYLQ